MSESLREKIARARYEAWRKRMREEHDLHYCSFDDLDARGADGRAGEIADTAAILAAIEAAGYELVRKCPKGWGAACSRNGGPYCCTTCIGDWHEERRQHALAARPKPWIGERE